MISWNKFAYNNRGILQVKDKELEYFAYSQLKDYKKGYFKEIKPLDVDDFVENYLKINIQFQKLSPNGSTFGMTAISDGIIPIINEDGNLDVRNFKKGTICIDIEACKNNGKLINSTICHEAAHSQFDLFVDKDVLNGNSYITDSITINGKITRYKTDKDWIEHHANKYMIYILMPSIFVKKLYKKKRDEIMPGKRLSVKQRNLIWKLIYAISKELNVSATAMAWRLLELKIISQKMFDALSINKNKEEIKWNKLDLF